MKGAWIRVAGIGIFHMVLYLYVVPFVIYPHFGDQGLVFAFAAAVLISVVVMGSLGLKYNRKKSKGE